MCRRLFLFSNFDPVHGCLACFPWSDFGIFIFSFWHWIAFFWPLSLPNRIILIWITQALVTLSNDSMDVFFFFGRNRKQTSSHFILFFLCNTNVRNDRLEYSSALSEKIHTKLVSRCVLYVCVRPLPVSVCVLCDCMHDIYMSAQSEWLHSLHSFTLLNLPWNTVSIV